MTQAYFSMVRLDLLVETGCVILKYLIIYIQQ